MPPTQFSVVGSSVPMSLHVFESDAHGRTFRDVISAEPQALAEVFAVLARADVQLRLQDAETHHNRPALSGALQELEGCPAVAAVLNLKGGQASSNSRDRFKRAVGTAVRIVMEGLGWSKTGRKSAVGVGNQFTVAERYVCV